MLVPTALAMIAAAAPSIAISDADEIRIPGTDLRLGDVVILHGLGQADRDRLSARPLARLPEGRSAVTVDRAALAALIRRSIPGLALSAAAGPVTIRTDAPKRADATPPEPFQLPEPDVDAGDELRLISAVGPVRIERKVIAMQPGRQGRRLFVRDEEGGVTSVPLHADGARERRP